MITTVLYIFSAAIGFWLGGWMSSISRRYGNEGIESIYSFLLVRVLAALAFSSIAIFMDLSSEWFIAIPFVTALLTISICDWRHLIIPDKIILPGIVIAAGLRIFIGPLPYWDYLLAALIGGGIFYLIKIIGGFLINEDALGDGDIKLLLLTGLVLGLKLTLLSFLIFCFVGTIIGIFFLVIRRKVPTSTLPFGPIISGATFISYIWGSNIIQRVYISLLF
ncbi:hypothetical protein BK120_23290 [Paenibacillus sp. FSL A5-0031]|uniref:prepilin peptidase n=1 Tax=Paenibacillus sp. FSL A5-0031 TaxID=1920420 RepID=UPI00096FF709|nr:A24 family peptidase [Paenibacillus sp. FSL A5-0031]OME78666.1 hypothetical protein BK120_23290 [Paenibacillus sp. FSL A5-0031]